jgi:hypothetical protein
VNYIGMDSHITTLDFAVINESGWLTKSKSVATGVKGLVDRFFYHFQYSMRWD